MNFLRIVTCLAFFFIVEGATAQENPDEILGVWYNEEKTGKIEIFKESGKYTGKIVWVEMKPGDSGLDENNPDPKLQNKPLVGLLILKNFVYEDDEYTGGEIYDPKNGKTYSCYMKMESADKLFVRGYIGFSLIGRTTYWTRVK